jgi:lipopolysaccharide/colanic/teichoic acid biosynthesis glycosyltransferase
MQMMDNADIYTVGRYSVEHNMASIMVGRSALRRVCSLNDVAYTEGAKCITLSSPLPFDTSDYKTWSNYIKISSRKKENRWVHTAVSYHLPEGEYIPDGMNFFTRNVKRLLDMIFSALAMVIFSPLFLITYIMVRMEDGGPAIFKQERIGRYGRTFNIYKFRSMRLDAEKFGPQLSHSGGSDDPRLTKVGRFIRAHHLDEMPQLWNVFIGDMAFVGPRPERKYYIDMIMEYDKRYECLYQIRPGVTSYATLYNGYTDTMEKMLRRLEYDLYYLGHRSWWFDLKILFYTFCSIVFGKKF